jgi:hypothetical protein
MPGDSSTQWGTSGGGSRGPSGNRDNAVDEVAAKDQHEEQRTGDQRNFVRKKPRMIGPHR